MKLRNKLIRFLFLLFILFNWKIGKLEKFVKIKIKNFPLKPNQFKPNFNFYKKLILFFSIQKITF